MKSFHKPRRMGGIMDIENRNENEHPLQNKRIRSSSKSSQITNISNSRSVRNPLQPVINKSRLFSQVRLIQKESPVKKRQKQDFKNLDEMIKEEFNKRKDFKANIIINNYDYLLLTNKNIINFQFKTGNNLSFELPFIIAKQELATNIIGRGNTNLDNYKIRTILSSLSLIKDNDNNDLIDNLNDVAGFNKCIEDIYAKGTLSDEQQGEEINKIFYCLGKYTNLDDEVPVEISDIQDRNSSSKSVYWSSSLKTTGGNPITESYLTSHHIFDNKHDFKSKCPKKNNSLCFKSMYDCTVIVGTQPDAIAKLMKECDPLIESKIFLNYINYFTNNDLKNFMYISFFDLNNVKLNLKLFDTMSKPSQTDYNTNIQNFMKQFTKTDDPTFFTDGVLSKGQFKNLSKFIESFKKQVLPQDISNYNKIKSKLEKIYKDDFIILNKNFNDYINAKQIISLETVNDPMATDHKLYQKYFKSAKDKYSENIIETFAAITSNMTVKTDYNNIFTSVFCKDYLDFVYYKKSPTHNEISFAMRFKNTAFTTFIRNNINACNNFNILYLEKQPNSYIYKQIQSTTSNSNAYIGFDLKEYKTYNSNNRISSMINSLVDELTKQIVNITDSYLKQTYNNSEATAFIVLYYLYIRGLIKIENNTFKNINNIDIERAIDISRVLFDLKKAGDLSKVLFTYYYTELDDNYKPATHDKVFNGLIEIKDSTTGLIKDQLIFSSNDTLAVLSGILRNKNDIFFNMQSCYSYFSYRTSDNLKLTLYDIFSKIKLAFGTKFIRNDFDISKSFEKFILQNNTYKDLHKICNLNTKVVILKNKAGQSFEDFLRTNNIQSTDINDYCKLFRLYTLSYFELYLKEFYINFFNTISNVKQEIRKYLFNSLDDSDINSTIIKKITENYVEKIFRMIDKLIQKIYSELVISSENYNRDVINYYEDIFLKQIELYQNIIQLIEQFLCFNNDETNFFINLANLNNFTNQIINLYFVSSDETKNITLPKIKKMDDINMLIVCLSDNEFASFIENQKDITKFNDDSLLRNLGINNFIKNLEIFDKIINNIEYLSKIVISDTATNNDIKELYQDFVYEIKKVIYFIIIQNIVPFHFENKRNSEEEDDDIINLYIPNEPNFIAKFITTKIKENIEIAFNQAKANKIKPISDKIQPRQRESIRANFERQITLIESLYDTKKTSIMTSIDDILTIKLEKFYTSDFLKNLMHDELIFFTTNPIKTNINLNNNIKLDYNLGQISISTIPANFTKITEFNLSRISKKEEKIKNEVFQIYNFLISNRSNSTATTGATPMSSSGGNKNKKTKKLKKY